MLFFLFFSIFLINDDILNLAVKCFAYSIKG